MNDEEMQRRAQAQFRAAADGIDAVTAAKLAAVRKRAVALAEEARPAWRVGLVPAGAFAAVTVVGVGVAISLRQPTPSAVPAVDAVEILLAEDDLALYEEDPEFFEWALEQQSGATADAG